MVRDNIFSSRERILRLFKDIKAVHLPQKGPWYAHRSLAVCVGVLLRANTGDEWGSIRQTTWTKISITIRRKSKKKTNDKAFIKAAKKSHPHRLDVYNCTRLQLQIEAQRNGWMIGEIQASCLRTNLDPIYPLAFFFFRLFYQVSRYFSTFLFC